MNPIKVTQKDAIVLRDMKRDVDRWRKKEGPQGTYPTTPDTFQGAIPAVVSSLTGIPAAETAVQTGRGKIKIRTLWYRDNDITVLDMDVVGPDDEPKLFNNTADEFVEYDCYNISTSQEWAYGDTLLVVPLAMGRFLAVSSASSGSAIHGRVTECMGNGYYVVSTGAAPIFNLPSPLGTGTGDVPDATGTGTGDSNCDMCSLLTGGNGTGEGDASCRTLEQPTRVVPGVGDETIYAYNPRGLELKVPGHVVVEWLGDYVEDPDPPIDTGTGTAVPLVKLYIIITGTYPLVGVPDRFYECCTGPPQQVIMVRCDTYIVEGVYCIGQQTTCPVVTGTGS